MPGKSRRHRGQHTLPSKKKRSRRSPQVVAFQPTEPAPVKEPAVAPAKVAAPLPGVPTTAATTFKHSELSLELRRIGIVAGIMLTALILLAVFWR